MAKKIFFPILILLFTAPFFSSAYSPLDIVVSEIAWMGSQNSANDEWIELYNNTENNIDLNGWVLKSDDKSPEIKLSGSIPLKGYFLLERTDDNSAPNIMADLIYKGSLENIGENLQLYDNLNNLTDEINCSSKWFSGNNTTKQTMEKINPKISGNDLSNWQTSENPNGTPKAKNSAGLEKEEPVNNSLKDTAQKSTINNPSVSENKKDDVKITENNPNNNTKATVSENLPKLINSNNKYEISTYLIAFALAILSGIAILILKKNLL